MRIPKTYATRLGLSEGTQVEVAAEDDRIVISVGRPRYDLADLVADLSHDDLHAAFDWGQDEGREAVE